MVGYGRSPALLLSLFGTALQVLLPPQIPLSMGHDHRKFRVIDHGLRYASEHRLALETVVIGAHHQKIRVHLSRGVQDVAPDIASPSRYHW